MPKISFTIPCYGSENTVKSVIEEIEATMSQRPELDFEIIAVNDGSPDNVLNVLRELAKEHNKLTAVDLSHNMGKHCALMAAFSLVTGDYVVWLDDDGQCPVNRLWELYDIFGDGYDTVMAKYPTKKQSLFKNFGSRMNSLMIRILLDKPKELVFSNFGILKRYVVEEIKKYKNPYPYMEGLILRTSRRIKTVDMEERERFAGKGNYTFLRSLKLFINGLTTFSAKPLQAATVIGIITAILGLCYGLFIVIRKLLYPDVLLMGYSSIMATTLFLGGMIMFQLGLIGEYIGRIYICLNNAPQYVIREIIKNETEENSSEKTEKN